MNFLGIMLSQYKTVHFINSAMITCADNPYFSKRQEVMMSGRHNILGKSKPDSFSEADVGFESNNEKNSINIRDNQTIESCNNLNEPSIKCWHPSKLEGYVSDEFRNVEFAD